jgi:hypothetical protein
VPGGHIRLRARLAKGFRRPPPHARATLRLPRPATPRARNAQVGRARWEGAGTQDARRWIACLLDRYSAAYASSQSGALQQSCKRMAYQEIPDPMAAMKPPRAPASMSRSSPPGRSAR